MILTKMTYHPDPRYQAESSSLTLKTPKKKLLLSSIQIVKGSRVTPGRPTYDDTNRALIWQFILTVPLPKWDIIAHRLADAIFGLETRVVSSDAIPTLSALVVDRLKPEVGVLE